MHWVLIFTVFVQTSVWQVKTEYTTTKSYQSKQECLSDTGRLSKTISEQHGNILAECVQELR